MASTFPGSADVFKAIPTPTTTATIQSDGTTDTLSVRLQQHSDAISAVEAWLIGKFDEPTGVVKAFAGTIVPAGYLLCDGSAVSRTTQSKLFTVIGTSYGSGDGSTTFNLPDGRGRTLIGAGQGSSLTSRTLATSIGEETHILLASELASHTHTATSTQGTHTHTDAGHTHLITGFATLNVAGSSPSVNSVNGSSNTGIGNANISTNSAGVITTTVNATAVGTEHNNMQPSLVLNWIIHT